LESNIYINKHLGIVEQCKEGNRKAQYELYKLYAKSMLNVCVRILNHTAEAEDVLQEAFVEAFAKIETYRGEAAFGAWLKQIVVNKAINQLRKKHLDLTNIDSFEDDDRHQIEIADSEPYDESETDMSVARIKKAMLALPEGYRVVLSLYLFEGYDHEEIAAILHINEASSRSQYLRGKRKLLDIIQN
jgi:RNA polymerase sigma factor (sigma-70 family)